MELRANMPDGHTEVIRIEPFDYGGRDVIVFRAVFATSSDTVFFELPLPLSDGMEFYMDLAQAALEAFERVKVDDKTDEAFYEIMEGL